MKNVTKTLIASALILIPALSQARDHRTYDYARVQHVTPVYRTIERRVPVENCWVEQVRTERHHRGNGSATATLVGGVIGGAIGHSMGRGRTDKKLGAVVGSVIGMSVGNDLSSKARNTGYREARYDNVERCEVSYRRETQKIADGYRVSYRYKGQTYTRHMEHHPGKRIKIVANMRARHHR